MGIKKTNNSYLDASVKLLPATMRQAGQDLVDIYKERRITQFRQADKLMLSLRTGNKRTREKTIERIEKLKGAPTLGENPATETR